jgi:hypothetical protein
MKTQRAEEIWDKYYYTLMHSEQKTCYDAVAEVIRESAARLCTDWAEGQMPQDVLYELADEVEELGKDE